MKDNVAERSPDGTDNRVEHLAGEWWTQRSAAQKVAVNRRDFFAEQQTRAPEASGTRRQWDSCRATLPGREHWNHDQVVAKAITNVLGND
jgi:hypothetical protein